MSDSRTTGEREKKMQLTELSHDQSPESSVFVEKLRRRRGKSWYGDENREDTGLECEEKLRRTENRRSSMKARKDQAERRVWCESIRISPLGLSSSDRVRSRFESSDVLCTASEDQVRQGRERARKGKKKRTNQDFRPQYSLLPLPCSAM